MKLNLWQWIGVAGVVIFGGLYLYRTATQPAESTPAVIEPSREAPIVVPKQPAAVPVSPPTINTTLPTTKPA